MFRVEQSTPIRYAQLAGFGPEFQMYMQGVITTAMEGVAARGTAAMPWMRSRLEANATAMPAGGMGAEVRSTDPRVPYVEFFKGKTIPWGKGSRLAEWAASVGIPAYLAAQSMKRLGAANTGKFGSYWDGGGREEVEATVEIAAYSFVTERLFGGV